MHKEMKPGDKVRYVRESHLDSQNWGKQAGLSIGEIYEIDEIRLSTPPTITLKGYRFVHYMEKFELIPIDAIEDPPFDIQWNGKFFIIDGIKISPTVLHLIAETGDEKKGGIEHDVA